MKSSIFDQKGLVIWFTGLSGSGKSTLAEGLQSKLNKEGLFTKILDGDSLRKGINSGLGFTEADRLENIRRAAEVAKLFYENEIITLCTFITPTEKMRELARTIVGKSKYLQIYVECSFELCEKRDVKGLYKKARNGEISHFTGISSSYETPLNSSLKINTETNTIENCVNKIYHFLITNEKFKIINNSNE